MKLIFSATEPPPTREVVMRWMEAGYWPGDIMLDMMCQFIDRNKLSERFDAYLANKAEQEFSG